MERNSQGSALAWLGRVLGAATDGKPRPFLLRPDATDPELLLPLAPRAVTAASLLRRHDARSLRQRVEGRVGRAGARVGGLAMAGGETRDLLPFALVDELARRLGEAELVPAITLGPRRRNRKPVLQLLRPDGEIVGFAKVGWSPLTRELVTREAAILRRIEAHVPAAIVAPSVLLEIDDLETADGEPLAVAVTTALDPSRIAAGATVRPRRLPSDWVLQLAGCRGLTTERFAETARRVGQGCDDALVETLVERHRDVVVTVGLWHGDLTPWNTLTGRDRALVWDWEFAAEGRPVGFDLLHVHFETTRRGGSDATRPALVSVDADAEALLAPAAQLAPPEAVVDLYLLELLARETLLQAGGDLPRGMGDLGEPVRRRLRSGAVLDR